jgi:hypothetical protein
MYHSLRPIFDDQMPQDDLYAEEFDKAEIMLGLVSQDLASVRYGGDENRRWLMHSRWFGRSTYRAAWHHGDPLGDYSTALATQGQQWLPMKGGLFGSDPDRAERAVEGYAEEFKRRHRG